MADLMTRRSRRLCSCRKGYEILAAPSAALEESDAAAEKVHKPDRLGLCITKALTFLIFFFLLRVYIKNPDAFPVLGFNYESEKEVLRFYETLGLMSQSLVGVAMLMIYALRKKVCARMHYPTL